RRPHRERLEAAARGGGAGGLGGRPSNHGGCGERSGGCERRARSSLLRRPTPGARPARRTSSVVAALAALAPPLVRLAHHDYSDGLLEGDRPCTGPTASTLPSGASSCASFAPCSARSGSYSGWR